LIERGDLCFQSGLYEARWWRGWDWPPSAARAIREPMRWWAGRPGRESAPWLAVCRTRGRARERWSAERLERSAGRLWAMTRIAASIIAIGITMRIDITI